MFWEAVLRWIHVFFGILWIGLLYYFNFVAGAEDAGNPGRAAAGAYQVHHPRGAVLVPLGRALHRAGRHLRGGPARRDYAANVFTFGLAGGYDASKHGYTLMGIGIYLAIIMFLNVWGVIWPNQKKVLGIVEADADAKASAARIAGHGLADQHAAVAADADLDGDVPDACSAEFDGRARRTISTT